MLHELLQRDSRVTWLPRERRSTCQKTESKLTPKKLNAPTFVHKPLHFSPLATSTPPLPPWKKDPEHLFPSISFSCFAGCSTFQQYVYLSSRGCSLSLSVRIQFNIRLKSTFSRQKVSAGSSACGFVWAWSTLRELEANS